MKIYIAGGYFKKDYFKEVANCLEAEFGVEITSSWLNEQWPPNTTLDQVEDSELRSFAVQDCADIQRADVFMLFSSDPKVPTVRGGRHVEMGIALALGKAIWVIGPKENVFHYIPGITHFKTLADLKQFMD